MATPIEEAGIAFAQMRANRKLVLDEDGKRWAEDVARALDEAENIQNALIDVLESIRALPCACNAYQIDSGHLTDCPSPAIRDAADAALRAAGRLP